MDVRPAKQQRTEPRQTSIGAFFTAPPKPPPGPGRPVGAKKRKRGRPPAVPEPPRAEVVARTRPFSWAQAVDPDPDPAGDVEAKRRRAADSAEEQPAAAPQPASTGPKRVNYSKGEALAKLTRAVHDWDNKSGTYLLLGMDFSQERFARLTEIPYHTLRAYICPNKGKRRELGKAAGRTPAIDKESNQFVVDVVRRKDRANEGMSRREIGDLLQDLAPHLSAKQAVRKVDSIRQLHKSELTGIVSAQASTTKRTAITVEQQYRWHMVRRLPSVVSPALHLARSSLRPRSVSIIPSILTRATERGGSLQVPA